MSPRINSSLYRVALAAALLFPLIAGCQSAMSQTYKAPNDFPLTFVGHTFGAYCYNTIGCRVIYNNDNHTRPWSAPDVFSGPPPSLDYIKHLDASYIVPRNLQTDGFPGPVQVEWKSLDGVPHEATLDLDQIFPGRRVLHHVPEADYAERSFSGDVAIILEVNDRTLTIYTKATIGTKSERVPGDPRSRGRQDLIQAWSRTY